MIKVVVMFEDFITDDIRCVWLGGWVVYVLVCGVCVHSIPTMNKCYKYKYPCIHTLQCVHLSVCLSSMCVDLFNCSGMQQNSEKF